MAITVDDLLNAVIAGVIGLAITLPVTYLIVDRIVENNAKKRLVPVVKLARERLRSKLGVGFLTTFLITLVIDVTTAVKDNRAIPKEVIELDVQRLKTAQSDLEMLLGVYNHVLPVETAQLTSSVIVNIEHLQEDFEYLAEIFPRPTTKSHASHIQDVILKTVRVTKEELKSLGTENYQIYALEQWLEQFAKERDIVETRQREVPIEVKGGHELS